MHIHNMYKLLVMRSKVKVVRYLKVLMFTPKLVQWTTLEVSAGWIWVNRGVRVCVCVFQDVCKLIV